MARRVPRRLIAGALAGGSLLLTSTGAFAVDPPAPPPELPRVACTQFLSDVASDAVPKYAGNVSTAAAFPSKPALDIRGLHLRLTSEELLILAPLGAEPTAASFAPFEDSFGFTFTAKIGGNTFEFIHRFFNNTVPVHVDTPGSYPKYLKNGSPAALPGAKAGFRSADTATGQPPYLQFIIPRTPLETAIGTAVKPDDTFTELQVKTTSHLSNQPKDADQLDQPAAQRVKVAGDDFCFGPAPSALSGLTTAPVQYGDATSMVVTLKGGDKDEALADMDVVFSAATGTLATARTDAGGLAGATLRVTRLAGNYPLAARFEGSPELRATTVSGTLVVRPEVTVFSALAIGKPTSMTRTATATLRDDDRTPVARQKVDWYVNGKKVATTTTDVAGKTTYKALKPGQKVQAKFPVVLNTYTASTSKVVVV